MKKIDWWNAYNIERQAAEIFHQQEIDGWYFDKEKAIQHSEFLGSELDRLYQIIRPTLKQVLQVKTTLNKPFKKDGNFSKHLLDYCEKANLSPEVFGGPFTRISYEEPNLGSPDQIKEQLFALGWKPKVWNYKKKDGKLVYGPDREPIKTSAKLTSDSYDELPEELGHLRTWMIYSHRLSQITGLINNVRSENTIPSVVDSCGTPTARVRHKVITNIPRPGTTFGGEVRELFIARPGRILVGEDRSQIEARLIANVSIIVLGHMQLADAIMGRDFHQVIYEALEGLCTDRQAAKKPEYAFFFGAKEKKLGQSIDNKPSSWSYEKAGKEVVKLMAKNIPGIIEVRDKLNKAAEKGYLVGLDGRKFFIRKPHAALNTYTQGNAQVLCKAAMIRQQQQAKEENLDVIQVGYFHDETQNDVKPEHAELFGNIAVQAIRDIGQEFKLHVPLDGEYSIGPSWRETH